MDHYDLIPRISVDELQKHTELDTSQENEFTADEARVRSATLILHSTFSLLYD